MKSPSSGEYSTNLSDQNCQFCSRIEEVERGGERDIYKLFIPQGEAVYVLSGGKCSFKATFLAVGDRTTIKIKPDYREASLLLSRSGTFGRTEDTP